jgi:hypothetical protein
MEDKINPKHLEFFKSSLEGSERMTLTAYVRANNEALKCELKRAEYLRLKFDTINTVKKILRENDICYVENKFSEKREKYLSLFDPSVLDDNGEFTKEHRQHMRSSYNGAIVAFENGDRNAEKLFYTSIGYPKKIYEQSDMEELEDIFYDATVEFEYGDKATGVFLLRCLAEMNFQYSALDDIILRSRELLKYNKLK